MMSDKQQPNSPAVEKAMTRFRDALAKRKEREGHIGDTEAAQAEPRRQAIDRPCSACNAGDGEMRYHKHRPPFRPGSSELPPLGEEPPREPATNSRSVQRRIALQSGEAMPEFPPVVPVETAMLCKLRDLPDEQIDTSDIPEQKDWTGAEVGKFYVPREPAPLIIHPDDCAKYDDGARVLKRVVPVETAPKSEVREFADALMKTIWDDMANFAGKRMMADWIDCRAESWDKAHASLRRELAEKEEQIAKLDIRAEFLAKYPPPLSCLMCGKEGQTACAHYPSGVWVCEDCRAKRNRCDTAESSNVRLRDALRDIGLAIGTALDEAVSPKPDAKEWRQIAQKVLAIKVAAEESQLTSLREKNVGKKSRKPRSK